MSASTKQLDPETPRSSSSATTFFVLASLVAALVLYLLIARAARPTRSSEITMSRLIPGNKSKDSALVSEFRSITGATPTDSAKFIKKYRTIEAAIDAFYNDPVAQSHAASSAGEKSREKKIGEIWEKFKDPSNPKLITIEGTMELCGELDINPEADPVLFCLASDLGSKATGEWEKGPFVSGWMAVPGVDSLAGMKAQLPSLRTKLNSDPVYFKRVYMHTFELAKEPGSRVLKLDTAVDLWNLYIPPALSARPSALSRVPPGDLPTSSSTSTAPTFSQADFEMWIDFQRARGKAVSKDTWSLFVDFVRSIDGEFKEYDEEAAWPSTIDDFVEHARAKKAGKC